MVACLLGSLEFLFQVVDLLSLRSGGVLVFLMKNLHEFIGESLCCLGDGWPVGVGVMSLVHEGA